LNLFGDCRVIWGWKSGANGTGRLMVHAGSIGRAASIDSVRRLSTVMLIVGVALWTLALLMQAGILPMHDRWVGPFVVEAQGSALVVLKMGRSRPLPGLTNTGGDDPQNPFRSNIAVTVAGERWDSGHTQHAELRAGRTSAFSHWGDDLLLALPTSLANGPQLVITANYALQPRPLVMSLLTLALALLGALRFRIAIIDGTSQGFVRRLKAARRVACIAGVVLAGAALSAYAIVVAYGWIAGYALPTVALFDVIPAMRGLAQWEPNAPNALFAVAGVGAIVEWLIRLGKSPSTIERPRTIGTSRGTRLALLFGAVFLTLLFVMSNGGWRGVINPADMNYMSIAGLFPHADAANYFFAATDLSADGRWDLVASQRSIAAAIRTGIVALGGSYVASLVLQAALLAVCAAIAILSVAEIVGVWSAMAFAGLLIGLERPYVTTTMTETLGLGAAALSAPFVLWGLRDQSYQSALAAFGLLTTALLIRMGSMFTLPFLAVWVVLLGVRAGSGAAALAGVALVGAGLLLVQLALLRLFGNAQLGIGGDFSFVLCGLATGTDWAHCFQSELARGNSWVQGTFWARPITMIIYEKAWQALVADPWVMADSLVRNGADYIGDFPILLFRQYTNVASIPSQWITLSVAAPILVVVARIKTPFYARALNFFILAFLTTLASATFIYAANGRRVMIVTNLLLSLGLAIGFAHPEAPRPGPAGPWRGRPSLYIIPALLLVFGLPALVKAGVLHRVPAGDYAGVTQRVAAPPVTPAVLVQPGETSANRRLMVVPSQFLRQIGHSFSFDPEFVEALDYAATHAPATLLVHRNPLRSDYQQLLLGEPELLEHRETDLAGR
jgi:hypothetical protein